MRAMIQPLVLLLAGVAVDGANSCIDSCASGQSYVNIYSCGLADDDIPDLVACFDEIGRDNIVSVYLADNDLTTIPEDLFQGFSALVQLSIADNWLDVIPSGAFDGLDKLVSLSLDDNVFKTLPEGLFDGLGSLSYLSLADNYLSSVLVGQFNGLGTIATLFLNDNELTTLPEGLFDDLGSLRTLHLQDNPDLQCVPTNGATTVKVDDISFDQCECTPSEAVQCDKGDCSPGESGYTCDDAVHKLGSKLHLSDVRSAHRV